MKARRRTVKRKFAVVIGLAALGAAALLGNQLWAQTGATPGSPAVAMPAQTKVAMINMAVIIKGYKKYEVFTKEMEEAEKPFREQAEKLAKLYKDWQAVLQNPKSDDKQHEDAQKYLVTLKRQLEDNNAAATKALGARRNEKLVQIYREIQDAVSRYARSTGIHIVYQYMDGIAETDIFTPANIERKMKSAAAGAIAPIYIADGLDISQEIVRVLNTPFSAVSAQPAH
jgi:Skp family chaperone for outer membrane proteins